MKACITNIVLRITKVVLITLHSMDYPLTILLENLEHILQIEVGVARWLWYTIRFSFGVSLLFAKLQLQ